MDDVLKSLMHTPAKEKELVTYTQKHLDPLNPDPESIDICDIAHALSQMCRANGHYEDFFSIGQHCIQCANEAIARAYVPELVLGCLLHDACDAYISEIARPVKQNLTIYNQIQLQLQNTIYQKYLGFVPEGEEEKLIRNIDNACLYYEYKYFLGRIVSPTEPIMISLPSYRSLPMKEVEEEFLAIFRKMTDKMKA